MKTPLIRRTTLLAVAILFAIGTEAADIKDGTSNTINVTEARKAVKRLLPVEIGKVRDQIPDLKLQHPCARAYTDAVKAARSEAAACLNGDTPPAGSPLAEFNALTNAQLASKCAGKTLDECVAAVLRSQAIFCAKEKAKDLAKAKAALRNCCGPLSEEKKEIEKALAFCTGN